MVERLLLASEQKRYPRRAGCHTLQLPASTPHRISLRLAARLLRLPLQGGVILALQTGDVVYTLGREHDLHHAKESGKEPCAGLKNHSPLEGESARGRSPLSSRRGGTRRPVSEYQRRVGGVVRALEGFRQAAWRTFCRKSWTCIMQAPLIATSHQPLQSFPFPQSALDSAGRVGVIFRQLSWLVRPATSQPSCQALMQSASDRGDSFDRNAFP